MAENKELTKIERELVLQYLRDDNVPITVTLEEKPVQREASLVNGTSEETDSRVPASAVFPVAIKSEQISVLSQGIILLKNAVRTLTPFLGKEVRVQFYFNHVGLYFITVMKECSRGPAIVVPQSIKRIQPEVNVADYDFKSVVSYKSADNSEVKIECLPDSQYRLFSFPSWEDIPDESRKEAKTLLEKYVLQIKDTSKCAIGNGVHLLSVVRYLTQKNPEKNAAYDSPVKPLNVIYVDDKRIVFVSENGEELLQEDNDYDLDMIFSLSSNALIRRTISVKFRVENIFSNEPSTERKCISCLFSDVKIEDLRYLFERVSGVKVA